MKLSCWKMKNDMKSLDADEFILDRNLNFQIWIAKIEYYSNIMNGGELIR